MAKEFRQLLLPSSVAAGAACMMSLFAILGWPSGDGPAPFCFGLSTFAFFGGIAVAAGMAFGAEFQQRTLGMLVSQPIARSRLWNEKMLALLLSVAAIGFTLWVSQKFTDLVIIHWAMPHAAERIPLPSPTGVLLIATCVVATVCSAGFWTLLARSAIGGIVLSMASQFFLALGVLLGLGKIYGPDRSLEDSKVTGFLITAGVLYSAIFLWLGRRKFARFELREVAPGESEIVSGRLLGKKLWFYFLRCRPRGPLLNLTRKEICVQKPLFLIAALFSAGWVLTLALLFFQPARKELCEAVFNVLTVVYVAVLPLLAGCISLGEEKAWGLTAWHLTLPISTRRQWLVKLAISAGVAVVLGFVLPSLLAWATAIKTRVGLFYLFHEKDNGWSLVLLFSGLTFVMGFWAVTLLANTLRAALASIISLVALFFLAMLTIWYAGMLGPCETGFLLFLAVSLHVPPEFVRAIGAEDYRISLVIAVVVIVALAQSLAQFHRAQTPGRIIWKYSAILAAVVVLLTFWLADVSNSVRVLRSIGGLNNPGTKQTNQPTTGEKP